MTTAYCARDRHDDCDGRVGIAGGDNRPACACPCHKVGPIDGTNLATILAERTLPQDREQAVAMLAAVIEVIGLGYHPDTPGEDYVEWNREADTTRPTFTPRQARLFDRLTDRIHDILIDTAAPDDVDGDIYGTSLDLWVVMGLIPDEL